MTEDLFGLDLDDLRQKPVLDGLPLYRIRQIVEWVYKKGIYDFSQMSNLPLILRKQLSEIYFFGRAALIDRHDSSDGLTSKFLLGFSGGTAVEAVLMRQTYGNSVCISTQAGCNMGCAFCASALHGLERDLTSGEMLAQVYYIESLLQREGKRINNMVIMGSGEPLSNYENVLYFIRLCHAEYGINMGYRNITVSTSGIVPRIYTLAEEHLPISLAISLHAPYEEMRSQLMPINKKYALSEVIAAGKNYADKTKRQVTYEYILIVNLNDNSACAEKLASLLRGQLCSVNLIPINPVPEKGFLRPSANIVKNFVDVLQKHHITVTVRREMGTDIQAACGQLRNKHLVKQ